MWDVVIFLAFIGVFGGCLLMVRPSGGLKRFRPPYSPPTAARLESDRLRRERDERDVVENEKLAIRRRY